MGESQRARRRRNGYEDRVRESTVEEEATPQIPLDFYTKERGAPTLIAHYNQNQESGALRTLVTRKPHSS